MNMYEYLSEEGCEHQKIYKERYLFVGCFITDDIWMESANNRAEVEYCIKKIRNNRTISDWIILNREGQAIGSDRGMYIDMVYPKYFDEFFQKGES